MSIVVPTSFPNTDWPAPYTVGEPILSAQWVDINERANWNYAHSGVVLPGIEDEFQVTSDTLTQTTSSGPNLFTWEPAAVFEIGEGVGVTLELSGYIEHGTLQVTAYRRDGDADTSLGTMTINETTTTPSRQSATLSLTEADISAGGTASNARQLVWFEAQAQAEDSSDPLTCYDFAVRVQPPDDTDLPTG